VDAAPRGSEGSHDSLAAVCQQGIGPCGVGMVLRPRQRGPAQARAVPSGGAPASRTPWSGRGPRGCEPSTSSTSRGLGRLSWVRGEPPEGPQEPTTGPTAPLLLWGGPWGTVPGGRARRGPVVAGAASQTWPDLREDCAPAWTPAAVGTACAASPWPSMLEEAMAERFGGQRQTFPPGAAALRDAERAVPVFPRCQAVMGEGQPVHIRSKVGEPRRAGARWLAVRSPGLVPDLGRHGITEASGGQRRLALTPAEPGARARARARPHSGVRPPVRPLATGPPRDELMDMRMGGQLSGPRVEDAHHAELPTAVVRGQRQSVEGSSRGLPPQVVQETWG
jgi:hypothetical protein